MVVVGIVTAVFGDKLQGICIGEIAVADFLGRCLRASPRDPQS